jgi:hypothetical protein
MTIFFKPLAEATSFVSLLNQHIIKNGTVGLKNAQIFFIALMITSMVFLGELCWYSIARATMNKHTAQALSWMLHNSKIPWLELFNAAVSMLINLFKINEVYILIDDTFRPRSKIIKCIFAVFKTIDKKTGGYFLAQNIIFIAIVTPVFTLPIGFYFYRPDPEHTKWRAKDKKLKRKKVGKKNRPKEPKRDHKKFPTRNEIAIKLLEEARKLLSGLVNIKNEPIRVVCILADAAYLSKEVSKKVRKIFPKSQFISQLSKNQICWNKNGIQKRLDEYFSHQPSTKTTIKIRGGKEKIITYCSARLFIKSHGEKLHVVALKYDGETEYRYLAATNLTWRTLDIIKAYTLRWLIEVVIEDWKQYGGFGRKASQHGVDGACRGVFLSLLVDCFLLFHPYQVRLYLAGKPLCTAGSLVRALQLESLLDCIKEIIDSPDPHNLLKKFADNLPNIVALRRSTKHMFGRDIGELGPSPHLVRKEKL